MKTQTDNGNGTYSFVMPEADAQPVSVAVTFTKETAADKYMDVAESA